MIVGQRRILLCVVLGLMVWAEESMAQGEISAPRTLRVAVKEAPPFALPVEDGEYDGLTLELWRAVAERLGYVSSFESTSLDELLDGVAQGRYDVGLGAITVTAEREMTVDFSHPFFLSGLGIATTKGFRDIPGALSGLFSKQFVSVVGGLALLLLAVGFSVWWFERRSNPQEFPPSPRQGLWSGFWFAAVSMTSTGYGDMAPRTIGGRLITLVWMFASVIVISFFTAAIATSLTVHSLQARIHGAQDLHKVRVGTVTSTTSATYLEQHGIDFKGYPTAADAVAALSAREVEAVVYDRPVLRWLVQQRGDSSLEVLADDFDPQTYALVLGPNSPLREDVNRALLEELHSDRWHRLLEQYLGR